jgi:ankyrin repeat protein
MMLQYGRTALLIAAKNRHLEVVRLLLEKGADIKAKDDVSYALYLYIFQCRPDT